MIAQPFTPLGPFPPAPHRVTVMASATARTVPLPGHAKDLHIVAMSENGHRFKFSQASADHVFVYGGGVTIKTTEKAGEHYYATVVSVTGAARVSITYRLKNS